MKKIILILFTIIAILMVTSCQTVYNNTKTLIDDDKWTSVDKRPEWMESIQQYAATQTDYNAYQFQRFFGDGNSLKEAETAAIKEIKSMIGTTPF